MLARLFSKLRLTYENPLQESDYIELKIPLNRDFFKYLLVGLTFLCIPLTVRYYIINLASQTYLGISLVALGIIVFLLRNKLLKYMRHICILYIAIMFAVALYNATIIVPKLEPIEAWHMGFGSALIARLVNFRVAEFPLLLIFNVASTISRFMALPNNNIEEVVLLISMEVIAVVVSFLAEKTDRVLFDSLYKSKNLLLKFKQLLTEYLPNPIAVLTADYSQTYFINDAFKKLFRSQDPVHIKLALDNLVLEDQNDDDTKRLLTELGYQNPDLEDIKPLKLSGLMALLASKSHILKNLGVISFQLTEQHFTRMEEETPRRSRKVRPIKLQSRDFNSGSPDHMHLPMLGSSKHLTKSEDNSLLSPVEVSRRGIDIQAIPLMTQKHISDINDIPGGDYPTINRISSDMHEPKRHVFKVKMFPLHWDNDEAIALTLDDVTHEKTIMELKIADKNKDLVIAMISHELRTPLNGMMGLLEIMKKEIVQPDVLFYLNACKTSGRLLLNLVNSILDFSQFKNNKLKLIYSRVVVSDLLNEITSLFDHFCNIKHVFLEVEVDPNVPNMIITDQTRLSQIIINLLGNAFKFTFQGGVTLKLSLPDSNDPSRIQFSVIDTGIGIKKEDQEKLFKLFGRLEQQDKKINTQGVGLGLTISNNLAIMLNSVEKKGIQVESEFGQGTTFSFTVQSESSDKLDDRIGEQSGDEESSSQNLDENKCSSRVLDRIASHTEVREKQYLFSPWRLMSGNLLPQCESKCSVNFSANHIKELERVTENKKAAESQYKKAAAENPWCLIVDDNPFNLMVAINIMKERGFQVQTALNGQEAIDTVKAHDTSAGPIRIILMDCQMPVMDGYEASRLLTEMMRAGEVDECPIVALTANNLNEEHEKLCNDAGMSGCLPKPLNIKDLEEMLKRVRKLKDSTLKESSMKKLLFSK